MTVVGFVSDFFREDLLGGAESNDNNLINYLNQYFEVKKIKSANFSLKNVSDCDALIISNFLFVQDEVLRAVVKSNKYIIYEHDHKYVSTRDPGKFLNFKIPTKHLVYRELYEKADTVVVLTEICKKVLDENLPLVNTHSIGCSLWSDNTFKLLSSLNKNTSSKDLCVMKSANPTKNYKNTIDFCKTNKLDPDSIESNDYEEFLKIMSEYKRFLFIPTVLETFSRICAEAKMLNLSVMTNKKLIGFFSENYSSLSGDELISTLKEKNDKAYMFFRKKLEEICQQ